VAGNKETRDVVLIIMGTHFKKLLRTIVKIVEIILNNLTRKIREMDFELWETSKRRTQS